ncbi:hypothetical protein BDV95DRAFT_592567 [Massariosphaeria phaeospora]|uniref:Secreted protein n=1 Tax=Massariosphaeria phaeospora TaxID=100035 RepID=A0A7C8M9G7_9PLEO|nr:hypothetical protein BDV95DRAFT_592567 [Massariosphaeria phaeospora]
MFSRGISTALAGLLHQLLLANFFGNTSAQQYSPPASLDVSAKLVSLLQDPTVKEHGNVARALDIIRSAETLPSCQRKATAELIKDCKTLEHSPGYVAFSEEVALELVRTEYAVRLALCELQVGEDTVHPACKPAVLSRESCHDNRFRSWLSGSNDECFRGFSKEQQKKCVRALGSQPQTWTSYSNARQNGVIVCQASRINIDRENDVARYQNLSYAVTHLEDALNSSTDRLKTFVADLVEQVRLSQEQALKDMNSNYETQVSDLGEYYNDTMNSVTDMVMTRVITLFRDLDRPADQVQTKLQNVFEEMHAAGGHEGFGGCCAAEQGHGPPRLTPRRDGET